MFQVRGRVATARIKGLERLPSDRFAVGRRRLLGRRRARWLGPGPLRRPRRTGGVLDLSQEHVGEPLAEAREEGEERVEVELGFFAGGREDDQAAPEREVRGRSEDGPEHRPDGSEEPQRRFPYLV